MRGKRRIHLATAAIAVIAAALAGSAMAAPAQGRATVTIRHEARGCHAWSYNGGSYKASLAVQISRGSTLTVVNNDVMPHKLVMTSGSSAKLTTPKMSHMSARASIRFTKKGVYRFTTKPGEDYKWAGKMKTVGDDNVLRLTVTVR